MEEKEEIITGEIVAEEKKEEIADEVLEKDLENQGLDNPEDIERFVKEAIEKTSPEKRVEATLFISAKFVSVEDLVRLTGVNPLLVKESLKKIKEKYENSDTAVRIIEKEGSWKMDVKAEYKNIVSQLATGKSEFSRAEQETLAIISYKQPIKQSVVIKIRGNKAYEHVKKFIEFGLVKGKKIGHTLELTLSQDFYDYFQIEKASE